MNQFTFIFDRPVRETVDSASVMTEGVRVFEEGEIPEYAQIWIWDQLYAQQLYALGDTTLARELKEVLEIWAVNMSSKVFQPQDLVRLKGHHRISERLELHRSPDATSVQALPETAQAHDLAVTLQMDLVDGGLPQVRVVPEILPAERRFWTVLAMAQHFIFANEMFTRELPIHILAFRKFHADILPFHTTEAAADAPLYAMEKAMNYFQSAAKQREVAQ